MKEMNTIRYTMDTVPQAARAMEAGELVAVPTETVYGLAAHAGLDRSVQDIYTVKTRNPGKPLSILVSGMDMVEGYTQNIPAAAYRLAEQYWPGPPDHGVGGQGLCRPHGHRRGRHLGGPLPRPPHDPGPHPGPGSPFGRSLGEPRRGPFSQVCPGGPGLL
ncbi:MAG: Sua5/YciO/YrdC/YwlC family protein [Ruminiclostridium sp.]|nr:Sua5/YciO/YrdC/YwlC family protein [Ruminiclostridium sp.]